MNEEKTNLPDIEAVEKPRQRGKRVPRGPASDKTKAALDRGRKVRLQNLEKKRMAKIHAANLMRDMKTTLLTMQEEMRQKRMAPIKVKPVEIAAAESAEAPQAEQGFGKIIGSGGMVLRPH